MTRADETLTMAYTAGGISAMGKRPRDDNPFDPQDDKEAYDEWDKGWIAYQGVTRAEASDWWWRITWAWGGKVVR